MTNSPDLAPLDYGINGIFKKIISKRNATTVPGMEKIVKDVWNKINLKIVRNVLFSWKDRVQLMIEQQSVQMEQIWKKNSVG